jgi:hypothetical protein
MRTKIASPIVLQSELQRIATYTRTPQPSRQVIAADLSQLARKVAGRGDTWFKQLGDLQAAFLAEVMEEAESILHNEGWERVKVTGKGGAHLAWDPGQMNIGAARAGTGEFSLSLGWAGYRDANAMVGTVSVGGWGGDNEKRLRISATSLSAMQVASQAIYAHFQGVLP